MQVRTRRIPVSLTNNPYEIVIKREALKNIGNELLRIGFKKDLKILIVTNEDVSKNYSEIFIDSLNQAGFIPTLLVLDAGENQKNQHSISLIHNAAYKANLERGSLMIALGGGVIGDMTGFAAATWLRGIQVVQVPTTLLAMVDASIGGKTGVNHPGGKNLIGAFHQPKLVLIDPNTLTTLPKREFHAGMAEVIKYGVISDPQLFELLENTKKIANLQEIDEEVLDEILERSTSSKAYVVVADEKENGLRAILNYGHTFGHVVENLCGYGTWLHGEAVAIGMVAAGSLALKRGSWEESEAKRQKKLLERAGLPTKWPKLELESIFKCLKGDKKVKDGKVRFIIPSKIGSVSICNDVTESEIIECLQDIN